MRIENRSAMHRERLNRQRLGEKVGKVVVCGNIRKSEFARLKELANEMKFNINMFHACVMLAIMLYGIYAWLIVAKNRNNRNRKRKLL